MDDISIHEQQLIELLRDEKKLSIELTNDGRLWGVRPTDPDSRKSAEGTGATFNRAWDRIGEIRTSLRAMRNNAK